MTLKDYSAARSDDMPYPGFVLARLVKGGPQVPCCIRYEPTRDPETGEYLERSYLWSIEIDGRSDPDPRPAPSLTLCSASMFGKRIDKAEYDFLVASRSWDNSYSGAPLPEKRKSVDLRALPPIPPPELE